jgi:hypothetical protein
MKRTLAFGSVMFAAVLLLPDAAVGQKKDGKPASIAATPQDYDRLRNMREITGKVIFADESSQMIAFRIDVPQIQPNQNKNGQGNRRRRGRYAVAPYRIVMGGKDFELPVENNATVQRRFVTVDYDDKGFLKNNKEDADLIRAKGYIPAKYTDIKSGMIAKFYLNRPKADAKDSKPSVRMVVLLQKGAGPLQPAGTPAKKKDQ